MAFDPQAFLDEAGIEYEHKGIRLSFCCPFCGDSDIDGNNFVFREDGKRFGCWRDRSHSGSLAHVVQAISGWPWTRVQEYISGDVVSPTGTVSDLRTRLVALNGQGTTQEQTPIALLPEFRVPRPTGLTSRCWRYLERRGFDPQRLVDRYGVRCAITGPFRDRLILPLYEDGKLKGWTGRAIGPSTLRYRAHPTGPTIKEHLYDPGGASQHRLLVVVEGPFDALRLQDACSDEMGVHVVALMGTTATSAQCGRLMALARTIPHVVLVLDQGTARQAASLRAALPLVDASVVPLPHPYKDPAELDVAGARSFCEDLLARTQAGRR